MNNENLYMLITYGRAMKKRQVLIGIVMIIMTTGLLTLTIGRQLIQGIEPSLSSFFIVHFAGYLVFLHMPVEVLIPFYVSYGYDPFILFIGAIGTAMVAQFIDYGIGYLFSYSIIHHVIGERKSEKLKRAIEKYGNIAIFGFNLLPLSSPILITTVAMVRYPFRLAVFYSFLGLTVKYLILIYGFYFFGGS